VLGNFLDILRSEYKPGPGSFLQIDAQKLAAKLDLQGRGSRRGKAGQPATSTQQLDEVEQEIVSAIRAYATDAHDRTHDQLSTYAQRLKAADISGAATEMRALARQAEGDFAAEILAGRNELEHAHASARERESELVNFRQRNRLERAAHPPKDHFVMSAILVIIFVLEVGPNAYFLSEGEALGIVGGISQAVIYSALNLGFAFIGGILGWTNLLHHNFPRKTLGLVGSLGIIVFVVGLNLAVAHYRIAVLSMPSTEAVKEAWRMMGMAPLDISDLKSAGMVALGILFAFIAMIEGYLWRDPYPGYSRVSAHHHKAREDLQGVIQEKIAELKGLQESALERIKIERSRLRDKRQEIPLVLEERKRLIARFGSHVAHLQDVGRLLLAYYRDANREARSIEPPPHFEDQWHLDGFGAIEVDDQVWSAPDSEYREADHALETSVRQLQESFETALRWIGSLRASDRAANAALSAPSSNTNALVEQT
jgi:hypothetical protein